MQEKSLKNCRMTLWSALWLMPGMWLIGLSHVDLGRGAPFVTRNPWPVKEACWVYPIPLFAHQLHPSQLL